MHPGKIFTLIAGKLENSWQLVQAEILFRWFLPAKSQLLPISRESTMIFAPHQDDETLGCGGLIALKRQLGIPVKVVFLTDGHKSNIQISREEITQIRKQEASKALNILGVSSSEDIFFLDLPDGELQDLSNEQRLNIINQLVQLLQSFQAGEIYVPHQKDRHCDHEAAYDLVCAAVKETKIPGQVFQYPVWLFWKMPSLLQLDLKNLGQSYKLDIKSVLEKKQRAIRVYDSQLSNLPRSFRRRFFMPWEIFFQQQN